ncbi:hypothetical protein EVAR_9171_1 [Eumeta japonica]|uniref:FLYWCH-type domain-containing protein n=1 Tax=Eumeta variegata TaxID=151549 RepID=A0A4C1WN24_EUMVA|nr:hypothetical protein EVAR_9171_1 [Eumeta japonica]
MLNGYSFSNPSPMNGGERWYCSGTLRWDCKVCLHVNDDYELVCISFEHNHPPPVYEKTAAGLYLERERHQETSFRYRQDSTHAQRLHVLVLVDERVGTPALVLLKAHRYPVPRLHLRERERGIAENVPSRAHPRSA